ncbi:MAG: hypothetical protein C7B46_15415 [Sulfobacillus benefaciens]|uniref:Uncharacterized protein n=1 Tax=Sulfobacillus benefaciens TaxID=453960 RepID=A0A2T2XCL9_9FIRM|nr:MAG: hypothetical protein C7B46_15415 [Sulfobacillus benefaciens]
MPLDHTPAPPGRKDAIFMPEGAAAAAWGTMCVINTLVGLNRGLCLIVPSDNAGRYIIIVTENQSWR